KRIGGQPIHQSMIRKSGNRFPAFAKPASAGEGRSEKIMLHQYTFPRIMTGELAPARHVPSAATRDWEPGSHPPLGALLGSSPRTQANPTLVIVTFGRTKRDRPDSE